MKICTAILAAGESKRLGRSKQWLPWKGKSLIQNIVDQCLELEHSCLCIITGADHQRMVKEFDYAMVELHHNATYRNGMSTSLKKAIEIAEKKEVDALMIVLCDQPLIKLAHYKALILEAKKTNGDIVTSSYGEIFGAPTIFKKTMFQKVKSLNETNGAKSLITANLQHTSFVRHEEAGFDIDTEEDYEQYINEFYQLE